MHAPPRLNRPETVARIAAPAAGLACALSTLAAAWLVQSGAAASARPLVAAAYWLAAIVHTSFVAFQVMPNGRSPLPLHRLGDAWLLALALTFHIGVFAPLLERVPAPVPSLVVTAYSAGVAIWPCAVLVIGRAWMLRAPRTVHSSRLTTDPPV